MYVSPEQLAELTELWARRERLASGIGNWHITAAMTPWNEHTVDIHRKAATSIYDLVEEAERVVTRIREIQGELPDDRPPVDPPGARHASGGG